MINKVLVRLVTLLAKRRPVFLSLLWRLDRVAYVRAIGVKIGNNCRFSSNDFGSEPFLITLGDDVSIGIEVSFIAHDGAVAVLRKMFNNPKLDYFAPINVGNNVFIGNRSIVLPGVTIGDNVVIGAGTVVTRDIPSNSIALGATIRCIPNGIEIYKERVHECIETKGLSGLERECLIKEKCGLKS